MSDPLQEWAHGSLSVNRLRLQYMDQLSGLLPDVHPGTLSTWAVSAADALALHELLNGYSTQVDVVEVGTFVGLSAFLFACHPSVRTVATLDPNPTVGGELNTTGSSLGVSVDVRDQTTGRRVQDIARGCLAAFPAAAEKIRFVEGVLAGPPDLTAYPIDKLVEGDAPVVAFIDGMHTGDAVHADLTAVLGDRPDTLVVLDDCRHYWGPFVQSGVARFLAETPGRWTFNLLADVAPALASTNLGVVYATTGDGAPPYPVQALRDAFSTRLDPVELLAANTDLLARNAAARARDERALADALAHADMRVRRAELRMSWLDEEAALREQEVNELRSDSSNQRSDARDDRGARDHDTERELDRLRERERQLSAALEDRDAQLAELHGSTSWRVTAPVRAAGRLRAARRTP